MTGFNLRNLCGCVAIGLIAATASAQDKIKVGEFASLTGPEAAWGVMSHHGTELAIAEINAKGGLLGRQLELLTEDDQSKQGEAKTCAQKLISRDHVFALLGEVASGRSLEAAPICQRSKIPMIAPSSTNPKVTESGNYIFRVCFIDSFQASVISKFALNTLKAKNVAVLKDVGNPYSVGLATYFTEAFTKGGGKIIAEQNYTAGDKDFKAQLTTLKATQPDAIYLPGYYQEAGLVCRQARELGMTLPIFGCDGWDSAQLLKIGGDAMNGTYFSTHFSLKQESPEAVKFVKDFQAKYGVPPDAMAALGYDSALLLGDAIKRAGATDGPNLREAIAATRDFAGATGHITIDKDRNASKSAVIIKVVNGKFDYQETINP